ncbi:MAG: hypothetical protein PHS63_08570 [Desulfoplanes sp.]|nr:hypothetical protein [Desulfoplanes sp.]
MTNNIFEQLKNESKKLAAEYLPDFYNDFATQHRRSKDLFFTNTLIGQCKADVLPFFKNPERTTSAVEHAKKVAIDAGTLVLADGQGWSVQHIKRLALLAQIAGLFHDICGQSSEHAQQSAEYARQVMHGYPLSEREKDMVAFAIRNHETARPEIKRDDHAYQRVSNAVYDADKFRWGADTVSTAQWEICATDTCSREKILTHFSESIRKIQSITSTFRTRTGQQYGPQFVKQGLTIAAHIHGSLPNMQ